MESAYIVLIPKLEKPMCPEHYRFINLCNIYKIVMKVVTNRLKLFLPRFIFPEQATFVKGRSITDNCMVAQEILH